MIITEADPKLERIVPYEKLGIQIL